MLWDWLGIIRYLNAQLRVFDGQWRQVFSWWIFDWEMLFVVDLLDGQYLPLCISLPQKLLLLGALITQWELWVIEGTSTLLLLAACSYIRRVYLLKLVHALVHLW